MSKWFFPIVFLLSACGSPLVQEEVIAETKNYRLTKAELLSTQPDFKNRLDSLQWVNTFVNSWLLEKLVLEKAKFNLPAERINFEKRLEEYENSLIQHEYEQELVRNYLDTIVSEQEIKTYYEENQSNFLLFDFLIQPKFIVFDVSVDSKTKRKAKKWFQRLDEDNVSDLDRLCFENGAEYELYDSTWYEWEMFSNSFNWELNRVGSWLRYNNFTEYSDSASHYFIRIEDYKLKNDVAPLFLVQDKIEKIILHQRKLELIRKSKDAIYQEAQSLGTFKRYDDYE